MKSLSMPGFVSRTPFGLILRENTQAEAQAFEAAVQAVVARLSPADARPLASAVLRDEVEVAAYDGLARAFVTLARAEDVRGLRLADGRPVLLGGGR